MKSFDTDLKKYAEKINLKVSERRELRERVLSYMEYHPLPKQILTQADLRESIPSESFIAVHFNAFHARIAGGLLVAILIIAPFIAEKSVPGDPLYLVKTGFNEAIQEKLASTPYEKIEFDTKLMERRIAEARVLSSEGKLTEEVKTQLAATVKEHTQAVQHGLSELRAQDADGAAIAEIAFNSSLEVQSAVLGGEESTENASLIEGLLTVVNEAREEVVSNQETSAPSFDGLVAKVELETTRVYELFETIKLSASSEEIHDIERRLSDIDRLILEAKGKHEGEAEAAVTDLTTTLGLIQKLIVFMTDIDIRESVTLETLVPVILSTEERVVLAQKEYSEIGNIATEVGLRIEAMEGDDGLHDKVAEGLLQIDGLLTNASTTLSVPRVEEAESYLIEARALATDIEAMTQHIRVKSESENTEENPTEEQAQPEESATSTEEVSEAPVATPIFEG